MNKLNSTTAAFGLAALLTLAGTAAAVDVGSGPPAREAARALFEQQNPGSGLYFTGGRVTTISGAAFSFGATPELSADQFRLFHAGLLGATAADLLPVSLLADGRHTQPVMWEDPDGKGGRYKFTLVYYSQFRAGLPVFRADLRLLVRNEPGSPLVLAKSALRDLGDFLPPKAPAIDENAAHAAAMTQVPGLVAFTPSRQVIWAGIDDVVVAPTLALEFVGSGPAVAGVPQKVLFLVDATTGAVVYTEDLINHVDITGNVSGMVTPNARAGACDTEVPTPLPYALVSITGGATAFADTAGNFTIPNAGATDVTVTSQPRGRWFTVANQAAPTSLLSQTVTPPGPVSFMHNAANTDEGVLAEVNAYIHANVVRDYTLGFNPAFPVIGTQTQFPVNVNLADTCNAFYDGGSINFFFSGNGCNNTAFGTVVHHEYGHHLVNVGGSDQGAYGEGFGDVMGMLITDNAVTGIGFSACNAGIRSANNTVQYPCTGEIHSCGTLLSGSFWATRNQLLTSFPSTYRSILSGLAINSVLEHQGSDITPQIALDVLTLDDTDLDITNGTPHRAQIEAGFAAHNMLPPALAFSYPAGLPTLLNPAGGTTFNVQVTGVRRQPQAATGILNYNAGSGFVAVPMTQVSTSPMIFQATFPALPCGVSVTYYVSARTSDNTTVADPIGGASAPRATVSGTGSATSFSDDFEIDRGWTVGTAATGDTATTGIWTRVDPVGTGAQPEDDHTPSAGTACFVTGQGVPGGGLGDNDVDGGQTTLYSPTLNLSGLTAPRISYWRWYSNTAGGAPNADVFTVSISNNNGSSWTTVETVGPAGPETSGGWVFHEFQVASFVAPTATVKVRFVAADLATGSLIEAAVDDFKVERIICPPACAPDWDGNGSIEPADVAAFVNSWSLSLGGGTLAGDFDHNNAVEPADVAAFINAWFNALSGGC